MSGMKADAPEPVDTANMFRDAAYWNRYNQYTPWGSVVWNDDRSAMEQTLSPEMREIMNRQMSLYSGALSEMMNWFNIPTIFQDFGANVDGGFDDQGLPSNPDYSDDDMFDPFADDEEGEYDPYDPDDPFWEDYYGKGRNITDRQRPVGSTPRADETRTGLDELGRDMNTGIVWDRFFEVNDIPDMPGWFRNNTRFKDNTYAEQQQAWAWYSLWEQGKGPKRPGGEEGVGGVQNWMAEDLPDRWWQSYLPTRRGDRRVEPIETGNPPTGGGNLWPYGTGATGGAWGDWGGRQPELFWEQNPPGLLSEINWDAIPDLPKLDQFQEDRDRITKAMYEEGLGLLDPYLRETENRQKQSLVNRGISTADEIGLAEMGDFGRMRGRALGDLSFRSLMGGYDEAARQFGLGLGAYGSGLQGELARIGASNQARQQAWNERMGVRATKWNELASLLGMNQMPAQQMGYNFNPSIDVMGGYGLEYGRNQYNSGLMNSWLRDLFGAISFA